MLKIFYYNIYYLFLYYMDSFFSLFTDGYKNKEDICRWIVCPDHSRRCEKIFLFIWKSKYSSSSFGLYSMSLLDTCLPPEQTFRTVLFCSQRILTNYKKTILSRRQLSCKWQFFCRRHFLTNDPTSVISVFWFSYMTLIITCH